MRTISPHSSLASSTPIIAPANPNLSWPNRPRMKNLAARLSYTTPGAQKSTTKTEPPCFGNSTNEPTAAVNTNEVHMNSSNWKILPRGKKA